MEHLVVNQAAPIDNPGENNHYVKKHNVCNSENLTKKILIML